MKKFRPYKAGFIVLYVLAFLCVGESVYDIVTQAMGAGNPYLNNFSYFGYLIAILALVYVRMYAVTKIEIGEKTMHIVYPVYIKPREGEKRALFLFRSGDTDLKLVDKRFALAEIEKYGYIEDLGYARLDASNADEKNKLFPVHEIALVMKDGKRYHVNGGFYSPKQLSGIVGAIQSAVGFPPEGKLAEVVQGTK